MSQTDDLLYLETDGGCANCGLRDNRALTIHHLEQLTPKNEDYDNKLILCHNCHQCHHQNKGPSAEELKKIKRRLIIKTLTRIGLNALKRAYRRPVVVAMPFLVEHLIESGYLEHRKDSTIWVEDDNADPTISGPDHVIVDAEYAITSAGRTLLEKWNLK